MIFHYSFNANKPKRLSIKRPVYRLSKVSRPKPRPYEAKGGPFTGSILWLVDGNSMVFRVGKMRGRYQAALIACANGSGTTEWRDLPQLEN